jgi:hypothetical protein
MNSRLKGMGIISTLFVIVSVIYYERVISEALLLRPVAFEVLEHKEELLAAYHEEEIIELVDEISRHTDII